MRVGSIASKWKSIRDIHITRQYQSHCLDSGAHMNGTPAKHTQANVLGSCDYALWKIEDGLWLVYTKIITCILVWSVKL